MRIRRPHSRPLRRSSLVRKRPNSPTAVVIVVDAEVDSTMLQTQARLFRQYGIRPVTWRVLDATDPSQLHAMRTRCERLVSSLRLHSRHKRAAVMAWCDVGSPLREVPAATSANIDIVRLMLQPIHEESIGSGMPDWVAEGRDKLHEFLIFPPSVLPPFGSSLRYGRKLSTSRERPRLVEVIRFANLNNAVLLNLAHECATLRTST